MSYKKTRSRDVEESEEKSESEQFETPASIANYETDDEELSVLYGATIQDNAIFEKGIAENLIMAQEMRSDSIEKWKILIWQCLVWCSIYHCLFSVAALEKSMMETFSLSNSEFSALTGLCFFCAIPGALITPYLIKSMGIYDTLLLSQYIMTGGQLLFWCTIYYYNQVRTFDVNDDSSMLMIMYFSRAAIGFSLGVDDVCVNAGLSVWFGLSEWSALAFEILSIMLEFGVIIARYLLVPIKDGTDSVAHPFLIGVVLGIASLGGVVCMKRVERNFLSQFDDDENVDLNHSLRASVRHGIDRNFKKILNFPLQAWLLLLFIAIGFGNVQAFCSQMEVPLVDKYGFSEFEANAALSLTMLSAIVCAPAVGFLIARLNMLSLWMTLSMLPMAFACFWLASDNSSAAWAWYGMGSFAMSIQIFFSSAFAALYLITPPAYIGIMNTVNAITYLLAGVVETALFGIFADMSGNYTSSITMIGVLSCIGFAVGLLIHCLDVYKGGKLHGLRPKKVTPRRNRRSDSSSDDHTSLKRLASASSIYGTPYRRR